MATHGIVVVRVGLVVLWCIMLLTNHASEYNIAHKRMQLFFPIVVLEEITTGRATLVIGSDDIGRWLNDGWLEDGIVTDR